MKILNNLSKPIKFTIHVLALILFVIAFVLLLKNQMLIGEKQAIQTFRIFTKKPVDYTLVGLYQFSSTFIEFADKHTQISYLFTSELVSSAKILMGLIIAILTISGIYALCNIFNVRIYVACGCSLLILILTIVLFNYSIAKFYDSELIVEKTKSCVAVITLLSISFTLHLLNVGVKVITSKK